MSSSADGSWLPLPSNPNLPSSNVFSLGKGALSNGGVPFPMSGRTEKRKRNARSARRAAAISRRSAVCDRRLRLRRSALRAPFPHLPTFQGGTHHDQDHPRFPLYPLWCLRQSLQPRCDQNGAERGGKAYPQGFLLFLPVLPRLPLGLPRHPAGRSLILL